MELSPLSTTLGYFHVIADPVSTCRRAAGLRTRARQPGQGIESPRGEEHLRKCPLSRIDASRTKHHKRLWLVSRCVCGSP